MLIALCDGRGNVTVGERCGVEWDATGYVYSLTMPALSSASIRDEIWQNVILQLFKRMNVFDLLLDAKVCSVPFQAGQGLGGRGGRGSGYQQVGYSQWLFNVVAPGVSETHTPLYHNAESRGIIGLIHKLYWLSASILYRCRQETGMLRDCMIRKPSLLRPNQIFV